VVRCDVCNLPINKDEVEDHTNEFHVKIDCVDCGKKLERILMSSHQKKCLDKLSICSYCELSMQKSELHEHEYNCGSKTEKCQFCNEFIPIMGN